MATDFTFKNVPEHIINNNYELNEWPQNYCENGETGFSYSPLVWEGSFIVPLLREHNIYYSPGREQFKDFIDQVNREAKEQSKISDYERETILLLNDIYNAGGEIDWVEE